MKKLGFVSFWAPIAVAVTLLCFMAYALVQQSLRISVSMMPIQLAEDAATAIVRGAAPGAVIPKDNVDISLSLAPFMIVYDDTGTVLASSAVLDGKVPELPKGVLDAARERKEDRVTWQPAPGVRAAVVVVRSVGSKPGFVLAGRSLREAEKLSERLLFDAVGAWAVTMAATLFVCFCFRPR